jgi:S1-C subfamily serine protease
MTSSTTHVEKPGRFGKRTGLLLVVAFVLGGLILPHIQLTWHDAKSGAESAPGLGVVPGAPRPLSSAEVYVHAAQVAGRSIVNIDTQQRVRTMDFFMQSGSRIQMSEGSGVIINSTGDILTNEHVVGVVNEAGKSIKVTLNDGTGRTFTGKVIGADHTTDVALVHIDASNLPAAQMGTVKGLVPGQMAVAIGNPLGYRFTVTHGVISALGRPINDEQEGRVYENLIQTDCAINPGNSGGALVNIEGQVIGINTIVASQAQGIGFAIPIDTALSVASELKRYGRIKRPWLGMVVISNTHELAAANGLPDEEGAIAFQFDPNGAGAAAGLHRGDVIVKINGKPVRSEDDYKAVEKQLKIGQQVTVDLLRDNTKMSGKLTVGEAP